MNREQRMIKMLLTGAKVGTDNATCHKIGTNQIPDVARSLRNKGVDLRDVTVRVTRFGRKVNAKQYFLPQAEIERIQQAGGTA